MFIKAPKHDILSANPKPENWHLIHEITHNLARECFRRAPPNQTLYKQFGRQIVHNFTQVWGVKTLYYFVLSNSTISCLYYVGVHIHSLFSDKKIVFGYKQTKRQNLVKKTVLT